MLSETLERHSDYKYLDRKSGVACLLHALTGDFLFMTGKILPDVINASLNSLAEGKFHNPKLQEQVSSIEVISCSYTFTDDPDALLKTKLTENYGNEKCLNMSNWPKLRGVFKYVHLPTKQYYVGTTEDLIKSSRHQNALLNTGKHKSPAFQKLYDSSSDRKTDFKWEWVICDTQSDVDWYEKNWKLESPELCLNSKRFLLEFNPVGVYIMTHTKTGHYYVGSAKDMRGRRATHLWGLKNNKHRNFDLQRIHNRHGDFWDFKYIGQNTRDDAYRLEQKLIEAGKDDVLCLNIANDAKSTISSIILSAEALERKRAKTAEHIRQPHIHRKGLEASNRVRSKPVVFDGVEYRSLRKARAALFPDRTGGWEVLYKRLNDPDDKLCYYPDTPK